LSAKIQSKARHLREDHQPDNDGYSAVDPTTAKTMDFTIAPAAKPTLEMLQFTVDNAADGVLWLQKDGACHYANKAVHKLLGYNASELQTLTVADINPEFSPGTWSKHWRTLQHYKVLSFQATLRHREHHLVTVAITANHTTMNGQEYSCMTVQDLTETLRAQEEIRVRSHQQAVVAELGRKAMRGMKLSELQNEAVALVAQVVGVEYCEILSLSAQGNSLTMVAGFGWQPGTVGNSSITPLPDTHVGYTLLSNEVIIVEDLATDPRFRITPLLSAHNAVSGISAIIACDQGALGLLGAYSVKPRAFNDDDIHFFQSVANLLAEAMERSNADDVLRRSDMLLRAAGKTARLGGRAIDPVSGRESWSDEVCAIHELPVGTSPSVEEAISYYAPEWRQRVREVYDQCLRHGKPYDEELQILTATGRRVWVRTIGEAVFDAKGGIVMIQGALQDITDRKLTELTLLRSEQRFRELADAMPMIVWTADPDGHLDYANQAMHEYSGLKNEKLPASGWLRLLHPDDREPCITVWSKALAKGKEESTEFRIKNQADGSYHWHLVRTVPVRNADGEIVKWYGTCTDIHDRKLAEDEIQRLANRLQTTLESITDAFYTLDRQWRFTYLNSEAERLIRRPRADLLGKVIWDEFPELAGSKLYKECVRAIAESSTVGFEERYDALGIWLEVHGYPSEEGLAVYFRDITERKRAEDNIQFLASYDPLTRLPNRRLVQDRLNQELMGCIRSGQKGALLFLDLDHFKTLNDTLGHEVGDALLKQVANRLIICLGADDTVGRFGGDEFVFILGQLGNDTAEAARQAEAAGQKILTQLSRPYFLNGHERFITPSIGITLFGEHEESVSDLLKRADFAMYQAKGSGRNTLRLFDPVMQANVNARVQLETQIREGLSRREFVPYYQPQVDARGKLTGAEALARWQHPERGLVPPGEFIPVAEESGLILDLSRYMLFAVCRQLAAWSDHPKTAGLNLSVNISARDFHHPEFVSRILAVVDQTGANPKRLKLEITESLLLADVEETITKMSTLKDRGVCFSLDDFGTGYSSLYYLKRLPLDQLKIDQRFVRDVMTDANDAVIVRTIIILARSLGLDVIAEGVETKSMRDFLAEHGCYAYQGYYYGRPMAIEQFEEFMELQPAVEQIDG